MAKDVLITPLDGIIQFSSSAGTGTGQVKVDGDDLVISNLVGDVLLGDGASDVFIGNGSDSVDIVFEQNGEIRDDGSGKNITLGSKTTNVFITSSTVVMQKDSGNVGIGTTNPTTTLQVEGDISGSGTGSFGEINLADDKRIKLGDAGDLQIFHNGDNSVINDVGAGDLLINGNNVRIRDANDGNTIALFTQGAGVTLNHDNSTKFETSDSGINVSGAITASGNISASGDNHTFGANVGIGTSSPAAVLDVTFNNTATSIFQNFNASSNKGGILINNDASSDGNFAALDFRVDDADARIALEYDDSHDGGLHFITDNNNSPGTRMYIASAGNVGIGTTTPNEKLTVFGNIDTSGSAGHITASGNISGSSTSTLSIPSIVEVASIKNFGTGDDITIAATDSVIIGQQTNGGQPLNISAEFSSDNAVRFTGNITASGDISSSGVGVFASLNVQGSLTASGHISASIIRAKEIRDHANGHLTIRPDADLNLGTAGTDEINIGRTSSTSCDINMFANSTDPTLRIVNKQAIFVHPITASADISSSGTITANSFVGNLSSISNLIANDGANRVLTSDNDGTLSAESAITIDGAAISVTGAITANSNDDDIAFQIKGSSDANLFQANPQSNDKIGIGTNTPPEKLTVQGNISASGNYIGDRRFNKTSTTDADYQGDVVYFGGTTSMTAGRIYHYKSDGTWEPADPNAASTSDGLLAVALGAASDTNGMLLRGTVTLDHDPGAVGDVLYLNEAAAPSGPSFGRATDGAPAGNGDIVRVIGYCLDASNGQIYFNPDNTFVEVSA